MNRLRGVERFLLGAIVLLPLVTVADSAHRYSRFLFVWAMEAQHPTASREALLAGGPSSPESVGQYFENYRRGLGLGKDFIAVFDVAPAAQPFGKLPAMIRHSSTSMTSDIGPVRFRWWLAIFFVQTMQVGQAVG